MPKIKLGYWDVRALAEPIRYALEYAGEDYEEKKYRMGLAPDFDKSEWTNEKYCLGLDFPNLPYIIDGDVKVTEAIAVLKYVCRKHRLMPKNDRDAARADNIEGVLLGLRGSFLAQFFTPDAEYEGAKKNFKENTFPETAKNILKFMGKRKWLVGDEITYNDFLLATLLKQIQALNPDCLQAFPRLQEYLNNFNALPAIKKYLVSDRFSEYPILAPVARWGFTKE